MVTIGWRWIFAVNVLPVLATLIAILQLPPDQPAEAARLDVRGSILAAVGLGGVTFALIEQSNLGWSDPVVLGTLVIGILAFALFLRVEHTAAAPMMPLQLFHARDFWAGNLITFLVWGALWLGVFIVPVYLQQVAGYSALVAGIATAPMTVISLLVSRTIGSLAGKYGPRRFIILGPSIAACGYLSMSFGSDGSTTWLVIMISVAVVGLGIAVTATPISTAVLSSIDAEKAGIGSAINNAVARVAGLIAVALVGLATGNALDSADFRSVTATVAVIMLAGSGIAALALSYAPAAPNSAE